MAAKNHLKTALAFKINITSSGLSIYEKPQIGHPKYWITTPELQLLLINHLKGTSLAGLPLRTRSKVVKQLVCQALGYEVPPSFKKTQPRFLHQCLDIYVQKSNNLQIWNEEIDPNRRYALIKVSDDDIVTNVRVVDGHTISLLDPTGTLTQKYQARVGDLPQIHELYSTEDTENLRKLNLKNTTSLDGILPTDNPVENKILTIKSLFTKLKPLVGKKFLNSGHDQERQRGWFLHKLICELLDYKEHKDNGRFPDIRNQLLEVKLQTSKTIDLGLVSPDSTMPLDVPNLGEISIKHSDVRYAIVYASINGDMIKIENVILTSGQDFFNRFTRSEGKVLNKKIQIPLPPDFLLADTE